MYEDITVSKIQQNILENAKNAGISVIDGSFAATVIAPVAYEIWQRYQDLNTFSDIMTMDTSEGEYIVRKCADFGIVRKDAMFALGALTFSGPDGTVIAKGTRCRTVSGYLYQTEEVGNIENGSVTLAARSVEAGAEYNTAAGTVVYMVESISGVSVTNAVAFEGGADIESIDSLKKRYFERVQKRAASGNAEDYRAWATETPGVENAGVIPLWNGAGTVKVVLFGSDNSAVTAATVSTVTSNIENKKPIGAAVTVVSCLPVNISIAAIVKTDSAHDAETVSAQLTDAVNNYFHNEYQSGIIYVSKIMQLIMNCGGVVNCSSLTLNGTDSDIELSSEEVPVLSGVSVSEVSE